MKNYQDVKELFKNNNATLVLVENKKEIASLKEAISFLLIMPVNYCLTIFCVNTFSPTLTFKK